MKKAAAPLKENQTTSPHILPPTKLHFEAAGQT